VRFRVFKGRPWLAEAGSQQGVGLGQSRRSMWGRPVSLEMPTNAALMLLSFMGDRSCARVNAGDTVLVKSTCWCSV